MNKYDYKTRCRALFVISIGFIQGYDVDLDTDFFISVRDFCNNRLQIDVLKYINYVDLITYMKFENHKMTAYESEKTVKDLFDILGEMKSEFDLFELYKNLKQKDIDMISEFASEYIEYLDELYNGPTFPIPQ